MRRTNVRPVARAPNIRTRDYEEASLPILSEVLFAAELVLLHASPVYYGLGAPQGDGSGVVLLPGFLCPDHYMLPLHAWLKRIGYQAFRSGISLNAECPNLLIERCLNETIDKALAQTGGKIHLIGHSLGALLRVRSQGNGQRTSLPSLRWARRSAAPWPTAAYCGQPKPFVRGYCKSTARECFRRATPGTAPAILSTPCSATCLRAVYTRDDGMVDWRYCVTDKPESDFAVSGTHIGLVFNPSVYTTIAKRLAETFRAE